MDASKILHSGGITIIKSPKMKFASINISKRSVSIDLHPGNSTGGMFRFESPEELQAHITLLQDALTIYRDKASEGTQELPPSQNEGE